MMIQANGTFTVEMTPAATHAGAPPGIPGVGNLVLHKHYTGDLSATSHGQMMTAMTAVQGSAGYVAIEIVHGSLHGKTGGFVLQHSGIMARGAPTLSVNIVPDSGSGELLGISGRCQILHDEAGGHRYVLDYVLTT